MHKLIVALSAVAAMAFGTVAAQADDRAKHESTIWAMEEAIIKGRGQGDLSPYVNAIGANYLGWPPGSAEPLSAAGLQEAAKQQDALKGEVVEFKRTGFTLSGKTAITYFATHRTKAGQGFADANGSTDVDQRYENIHVWSNENGKWKLVGGIARLKPERR